MKRTSLGAGLTRWIALATAISIAVYAATAALVFWLDEIYEDDDPEPDGFDEDDAAELVTQVAFALALAAPVGLLLSTLGSRWLVARATRRIDEVITTAARMSAEDLRARLPVSGADDELDELARALNALFGRIDAGIAAQRQFAADASHELRSPLTVLASTLEVARARPRSPGEWEGFADDALAEVRHMTDLVDGLLHLARAGSLRIAPAELAPVIDGVLARWASAAEPAGVALTADVADDLRAPIDAGMLEVALGNLVANALAHTPAGGSVHVHVHVVASADALALHVDDSGRGVPPSERDRIFTPFVRSATPTADRVHGRPGLGLGLAIVRRIAEGHGGTITVGDAPEGGARFTLRLPLVSS